MAGFEKLSLDLSAGTARHGVFVISRMKDDVDELRREFTYLLRLRLMLLP